MLLQKSRKNKAEGTGVDKRQDRGRKTKEVVLLRIFHLTLADRDKMTLMALFRVSLYSAVFCKWNPAEAWSYSKFESSLSTPADGGMELGRAMILY